MASIRLKQRSRLPVPGAEGSTTVEFALVAPVLIVLLFGIIEFGTVFKDVLAINQAAREGARAAAVGASTAAITTRVKAAAPTVNSATLAVSYTYRTCTSGTWSSWSVLGDSGDQNAAPAGAQVKIAVSYPHNLLTGGLFSRIADPHTSHITLTTSTVMRRE